MCMYACTYVLQNVDLRETGDMLRCLHSSAEKSLKHSSTIAASVH